MTTDMLTRTIQIIIAPVVMITACAIALGALQTRYAAINERLRLMARERLDLLRALGIPIIPVMPAGNTAQRESDSYAEERLIEIDAQIPQLLRRHLLAHRAVLAVYCAMIAFMSSMGVIAAAVVTNTTLAATAALIVFLLGMLIFLIGIVVIAEEVRASHRTIQYEVERVFQLGRTAAFPPGSQGFPDTNPEARSGAIRP